MAETRELQKIACPSCGSKITKFGRFDRTLVCPACGNTIINPVAETRKEDMPERMIPFTTQEGDFESALVNTLVNQDYVPKNVFQAINTGNVFRAYLPMYLYEGTYQASWSCESSYSDQEVKISDSWTDNSKKISTKNVKKWRPQNGNASGNFGFLCLANESADDLPQELRNFTSQFPYDVMMSKKFDPEMLGEEDSNLITIPRNADETLVWQKHGKNLVDDTAERAALDQIGNQEIRNFRASSSCSLTTKGEYMLVPFWFVYYTYDNQKYNFMMDGTGQHYSYTYPVDQEEVDFVNGKEKIKNIVKWLWLLLFVVWYLSNYGVAFAYLAIWIVAKIFVNKKINKDIDDRLTESRNARQSAASNL